MSSQPLHPESYSSSGRELTEHPDRSIAAAPMPARHDILMIGLCMFIGCVSAYDMYLTIKFQDFLTIMEINPIGRWLMALDGGSVAFFMSCKMVGTMFVLSAIIALYRYRAPLGMTVTWALAGIQALLAIYLTFF